MRHVDAASWYAETLGWHVFPTYYLLRHADGVITCSCNKRGECPNPGKHPRCAHGVKDATIDINRIRGWWLPQPTPNIAIACGASGVTIVDVDPRHGGDKSLAELEARHGALPLTVTAISGGGGPHFYYQAPAIEIKNSDTLLGQGIDIRGVGGYAVIPPSGHKSGRRYQWAEDHAPWEIPIAPLPDWIITALSSSQRNGKATPPAVWCELVRDGVEEGERNNSIYRLACHLAHPPLRGVDREVAQMLIWYWNEARNSTVRQTKDEVIRTINSAYDRLQEQRRFRNIRR
jgi:hypothetical protein